MENDHFIFCDGNGRLNCINICDLTKVELADELENFVSKFAEYADKYISEIGREKRYGK